MIGTFGQFSLEQAPLRYRHHAGGWGKACPHKPRSGMTVVPPPPCPECVREGNAAAVMSESQCEAFEFLLFKGHEVVVCMTCWKYGTPGQDHRCQGQDSAERPGDYRSSLLELVGITPCKRCEGKCSICCDRTPCCDCGGRGFGDAYPTQPHSVGALGARVR